MWGTHGSSMERVVLKFYPKKKRDRCEGKAVTGLPKDLGSKKKEGLGHCN